MPGLSDGANLAIATIFVASIGFFIYWIDRRVKKEGELFKRDNSLKSRVYAFIVGLLIGGFAVLTWIIGFRFYPLFLAAVILIAYSVELHKLVELFEPAKTISSVQDIDGVDWTTTNQTKIRIQAGGKFVVFEYCLSLLPLASTLNSKIYFVWPDDNFFGKSIGYNVVSILCGWTNPIRLIRRERPGYDFS